MGVTGPMNFKKKDVFFFGKSCSRDFGDPGCYPSTLIDLVNPAMASKDSAGTICMIWEGCRTHRCVTGPMNFKKRTFFFFWKIVLPGFWGPWLPSNNLIDLTNTTLASRDSLGTICMVCEGCRTHRGVTGPMNFKKKDVFFSENRATGDCGAPGCHPDTLIDLANIALAGRVSREPISMILEGYRTHRGVTLPMDFKSRMFFFLENRAPGILGPLAAIQAP